MDETSIVYDYAIKQVRVFSDREGVINGIRRRVGHLEGVKIEGKFAYIPMQYCRGAQLLTKQLANPITAPEASAEEDDEAEESVA